MLPLGGRILEILSQKMESSMEVFRQQQARGVCGKEKERNVNSSEIIPSDCLFYPPDSLGHQTPPLSPESLDL